MPLTPDAKYGPRYEEGVIWEERPSVPTEAFNTRFVQNKGLMTFADGVARPVGETRESIWQSEVDDVFVDDPPGAPTTGYRVVVGSTPTGVFVGHGGEIAQWTGVAWVFTTPRLGTATTVKAIGIETPYIQSSASAPWIWDKLNPSGNFGSELHYKEDLTLSATTSPVFQTKLTLVSDPLPLGTYFLVVNAVVSGTQLGTNIGARLLYDGAQVASLSIKPNVSDGEVSFNPYDVEINISGSHTWTLQWAREGGGGSATISGSKMTLWRLS